MMATIRRCDACAFFQRPPAGEQYNVQHTGGPWGICRRHPPVGNAGFATVGWADWCGEFRNEVPRGVVTNDRISQAVDAAIMKAHEAGEADRKERAEAHRHEPRTGMPDVQWRDLRTGEIVDPNAPCRHEVGYSMEWGYGEQQGQVRCVGCHEVLQEGVPLPPVEGVG